MRRHDGRCHRRRQQQSRKKIPRPPKRPRKLFSAQPPACAVGQDSYPFIEARCPPGCPDERRGLLCPSAPPGCPGGCPRIEPGCGPPSAPLHLDGEDAWTGETSSKVRNKSSRAAVGRQGGWPNLFLGGLAASVSDPGIADLSMRGCAWLECGGCCGCRRQPVDGAGHPRAGARGYRQVVIVAAGAACRGRRGRVGSRVSARVRHASRRRMPAAGKEPSP